MRRGSESAARARAVAESPRAADTVGIGQHEHVSRPSPSG
jgi:hypothetical protein